MPTWSKWPNTSGDGLRIDTAVAAQPRLGVGSRIVESVVRRKLGGSAELSGPPQRARRRFVTTLETVKEILAARRHDGASYSPGTGLMRPAQGLDAVAYIRLGMRPARNPR